MAYRVPDHGLGIVPSVGGQGRGLNSSSRADVGIFLPFSLWGVLGVGSHVSLLLWHVERVCRFTFMATPPHVFIYLAPSRIFRNFLSLFGTVSQPIIGLSCTFHTHPPTFPPPKKWMIAFPFLAFRRLVHIILASPVRSNSRKFGGPPPGLHWYWGEAVKR